MSEKKFNVCVVGVGAVGMEILRTLKQRQFPIKNLKVLARSERTIEVDGESIAVEAVGEDQFDGQDIVLFAGTEGEKGAAVLYSKIAIEKGAVAIDNGADFRMDPEVPLVVPEVNPEAIQENKGLIANPNCSTIQMVVALHALGQISRIKRVVVSTYQAVSGAGKSALGELTAQSEASLQGKDIPEPEAMSRRIGFNAIPQIGGFQDLGFTSEEWKMILETQKILNDKEIQVNATAVRVPVYNGHSESVYVEFEQPVSAEKAKAAFEAQEGIVFAEHDAFPMPVDADGEDPVYIGRLRPDPFNPKALSFWCVADNLRKGAALNAVQIAEKVIATETIGQNA